MPAGFYLFLSYIFLVYSCYSELPAQIPERIPDYFLNFCNKKLLRTIEETPGNKFPFRTKGWLGEWECTEAAGWTSGFFPGCLWLSYELLPDSNILNSAIKFTEGLKQQRLNKNTHDVGFMIMSSFGNGFRLTGRPEYKEVILDAAKSLSSRFNKKTGCIQSWDGEFQVIIDNMMNLELLFWAAKNGGSKEFFNMAVSHAYKTIENHLRPDGSSYHVVVYDTSTGKVIKKRTHQGYSDNSSWARGEAWGIYGFTMCYRETHDSLFLNTAIKMADYFIKNLPEDNIPYWDLKLPENSRRKFKDASAAAIALSALIELSNYLEDKFKYLDAIENTLSSLLRNGWQSFSNGLLLHCAYNVNSSNPYDWDASAVWGDYYFLESLSRYKESFISKLPRAHP